MKTPKEEAIELFNEHYAEIMVYDTDLSEEILVSILSIKHSIITCQKILKALNPVDYTEIKRHKDIIAELQKM